MKQIMQMTNSWVEKGRAQGRVEGRRELVARLLRRGFGRLPSGFGERLRGLSESQVDELGEAIFDFGDASDAVRWLESQSHSNGKRKKKN